MSEKGQSGELLGVLRENLLKEGLLNSPRKREDLSLEYKFVCGARVVRLCRRISDFSQDECFSVPGADVQKLSVTRELTTVGFAESGRESIKLKISFFAQLSASSDEQQLALVLCIEDTFFSEKEPLGDSDSYIFPHKTMEGFLFRECGLYLQFSNQDAIPSSQSPESKQVIISEQSGFFQLKNSQLSFQFSLQHSNQGFSAKGELSCPNRRSEIVQNMGYHIEVLNKTSKRSNSTPLNNSAVSTQPESQLKLRQRSIANEEKDSEDIWIETHSQTEEILSDEKKQQSNPEEEEQLNQSRQQSSIEDTCCSSKAFESSYSKQRQSFSQIIESPVISMQPKKNVVKNFVKAFRSFVSTQDDQVKAALGGCSEAQLQEFRSTYYRFETSKSFNNKFIKNLILNDPFKPVFAHFIKDYAQAWLQSSLVNNKEAHKEVLQDYLKAVLDTENIDQVYSLRTRNRLHLHIK